MPDTEVSDVTMARIAEIFDEQQLQYRIEDGQAPEGESEAAGQLLRTGFSNTIIAMQYRSGNLIIDSVWRGQVPTSQGPELLRVINDWNADHFAPTLRFFESGSQDSEHYLAVSAVRELNVSQGATRNQLGAFVMSTLNSLLEAYTFVEAQYPQLVTWKEPQHD